MSITGNNNSFNLLTDLINKNKCAAKKKLISIASTALILSGCATPSIQEAVSPLKTTAPTIVQTDYTHALKCLARHANSQEYLPPRIAVGHITDLTGASDAFNGRRITQGATLMAMTAVSDAGMRLIERFDLGVLQAELDYANAGLLRDSDKKLRTVNKGQVQGADLYIVGGITEFNPNIQSGGTDFFVGSTSASAGALALGKSYYIIDVGIDLRLVNAKSSEVLSVRSLRKQIVGYERESGAFDFLGTVILDVGTGKKALEPVQSSIRTTIDRAVFEFMAGLYNLPPEDCFKTTNVHEAANQINSVRGADRFNNYVQKASLTTENARQQYTARQAVTPQSTAQRTTSTANQQTLAEQFVLYSGGENEYFAKLGPFESQKLAQSAIFSHNNLSTHPYSILLAKHPMTGREAYLVRIGPLNQNSMNSVCLSLQQRCDLIAQEESSYLSPYRR